MSKGEKLVSPSLLRELLELDVETGRMTWRARKSSHFTAGYRTAQHQCALWNSAYAGREAFYSVDLGGYRHGYIKNLLFSAARVSYAIHNGNWPRHHVDHVNGRKTDDRPENLRDVPQSQNMRNRAISSNSSTKVHGVSLHLGKYDAYITDSGRKRHLGRFDTLEEATTARRAAERALGYHENHGRKAA